MTTEKSDRLSHIQALRALACCMVLLQHISLSASVFERLPGNPTMPFYLGVELFFVISGFVVTRSIFKRDLNPVSFLIRRFYRLTPAIVAFLAFSLFVFTIIAAMPSSETARVLRMVGADKFLSQALAVLLGFLINLTDSPLYYFGAMWSLSVEYQFYALYALIVGILAIICREREQVKLLVFSLFSSILLTFLALRVGGVRLTCSGFDICPATKYLLDYRFDFLLCGAVLAYAQEKEIPRLTLSRAAFVALGCMSVLIVFVVGMWSENPLASDKIRHDRVLMPLAEVAFAALVVIAANGPKAAQLSFFSRVIAWIGDRSFSIYLYHFPVMALLWALIALYAPFLFYKGPFLYGTVQAILTFLLTFYLADLTYKRVELPWNAYGEKLSSRVESFFAQRTKLFSVR